ncbi:hypothetical protein AGLY_018287 [Aphis glycines]|uniref:DDE-1 domain-containing protein n=1 Tax=Aphis glycines TaxID=307491 RepID=A0A6G0ST41_APHGL|nr:hypothetical protein AGLY_018287 [Aphis glycines]
MPRTRERTSNRGNDPDLMRRAADMCINEGKSERSVAGNLGICHVSLNRYIKKVRATEFSGSPTKCGYRPHTRIFDVDQETILAIYLKNYADMYFGLSTKDVRKLAFEFAKKMNLKMPVYWTENKFAGIDWFVNFLKRNPTLSIHQPEATSLSRGINFNPINVNIFMDKYESVLTKHKFEAFQIFNLDETGITTVQNPCKIVAQKGKKQIGAITSAERGTLVTMCLAVSAIGNAIPPMFIFPRVNFKDHFIRGGSPSCIGTSNKSGWMQGEEVLKFITHFTNHVRPTIEKKVLILLDNHESHLYLPVIDFCRANGIVLLSFPPHYSHKLQPLDRSVFGPFKKCINQEMVSWLKSNPGKRFTIYDLAAVTTNAILNAATPRNITSGFAVSGVWPFNRNAFSIDEFAPAVVTDIMLHTTENNNETQSINTEIPSINTITQTPSINVEIAEQRLSNEISPEMVRPYPKVQIHQKIVKKGGRKKGKTAILTDTPEKNELENKTKKKNKNIKRKLFNTAKKSKKVKATAIKKQKNKNKTLVIDSNDDEDAFCTICSELYSDSKSGEP